MILPHQTEPPTTAGTQRTGLPIGRPYAYRGSGHDEIQPEECCAECMRAVRNLRARRTGKEE